MGEREDDPADDEKSDKFASEHRQSELAVAAMDVKAATISDSSA